MTASSVTSDASWFASLRESIAKGDEASYRRKLVQHLDTAQGGACARRMMESPEAALVMRRSYDALVGPLGLSRPEDLVGWLRNDENTPQLVEVGARDVVSMALPYFRHARAWARSARMDASYAVAMGLMFFEPVIALCHQDATLKRATDKWPVAGLQEVPSPVRASPSFANITHRA